MTENPTKRATRKAEKRQSIVDAARRVWEKDGSYEYGTVRAIVKEAGVSTGSLFLNWKNKEALWLEVMGYPAPRDCAEVREALKRSAGL